SGKGRDESEVMMLLLKLPRTFRAQSCASNLRLLKPCARLTTSFTFPKIFLTFTPRKITGESEAGHRHLWRQPAEKRVDRDSVHALPALTRSRAFVSVRRPAIMRPDQVLDRYTPEKIHLRLEDAVIGQDAAKRAVVSAVWWNLYRETLLAAGEDPKLLPAKLN